MEVWNPTDGSVKIQTSVIPSEISGTTSKQAVFKILSILYVFLIQLKKAVESKNT